MQGRAFGWILIGHGFLVGVLRERPLAGAGGQRDSPIGIEEGQRGDRVVSHRGRRGRRVDGEHLQHEGVTVDAIAGRRALVHGVADELVPEPPTAGRRGIEEVSGSGLVEQIDHRSEPGAMHCGQRRRVTFGTHYGRRDQQIRDGLG